MEVGQTVGGLSWEKFDGADDYVEEIRRSCGVSEFLAKCLASLEPRFESMEEVRAFLSPSMSDYFDPYLMKGMAEAVARLRRAISAHEHIRIVTDYDADGTMSMLILKAMLKILKHAEQTHYIPNRQEHYGFSLMAAQKAVEDGVELIVTADIGVKDEAAIGYAQSHGVDVIVLDHHLPDGGGVPRAAYVVVCPPQEGCTYPNPHLAACGISLKLAQAMLADNKYYARIIASMSKMAALGTVADVVSLRNIENRAIVATGLAALNEMKGNNAGVNALLNASGARLGAIRSEDVSFRLAPLINAAGRMASAMHVIDLIEAPNEIVAQQLADKLRIMNEERKAIQEKMVERARAYLEPHCARPFLFVAFQACDMWRNGVAGIVAGRLKECFNKTVAVGTIENGEIVCSVRAMPGVHAVEALERNASRILRWGGHAAAAGFSIEASQYEAVWDGMCASIEEQIARAGDALRNQYVETLAVEDVTSELFGDLEKLEPCGTGNKSPFVCIKDVVLTDVRECRNRKLRATVKCPEFELTAWIAESLVYARAAMENQRVTLFGKMNQGYYRGYPQYSIEVVDMLI